MKKWVLMLGVSFLSFSSFGTDYEFGSATCENFEGIEEDYNKYHSTDEKIRYAYCLLVKGNYVGDQSLVVEGLDIFRDLVGDESLVVEGVDILRDLVEDESLVEEGVDILRDLVGEENEGNIVASYYYGLFYYTKGVFDNTIAKKNLNLVARHFTKTFEYIKNNPSYYKEYAEWEKASDIEMGVYNKLTNVYLQMYFLRLAGDFKVLNSEDGDTYSEYVESATHYIDLAKMHAEECRDLEDKDYFRKTAKLFKEACATKVDRIEVLKEIQVKREEALEECGEDVSEKVCPKIHRLNKEFVKEYVSIFKDVDKILDEDSLHTASSE